MALRPAVDGRIGNVWRFSLETGDTVHAAPFKSLIGNLDVIDEASKRGKATGTNSTLFKLRVSADEVLLIPGVRKQPTVNHDNIRALTERLSVPQTEGHLVVIGDNDGAGGNELERLP